MKPKEKIQKNLNQVVKKIAGKKEVEVALQISEKSENGEYFSNVALRLSAVTDKKPLPIAEQIKSAYEILKDPLVEKIEVAGPGFLNFFISENYLKENLTEILDKGDDFGKSEQNKGKRVIVEFSSPNIAKPFTVGHLRSTIIGSAISNLLSATGWDVHRDNHLGDWGTQFGKQIYAIKTWGDEKKIEESENPVKDLVELYVKFHEEAEKNPKIEDEGRAWFKKLEDGDPEARRLWRKCVEWSMQEFNKLYKLLGVTFSENNGVGYGESFFENKMEGVIRELRAANLLKENEGAELVYFPEDEFPPLMILKQDGTSLYATRDLATDRFRLDLHGKDTVIINEVGVEQSLYFQQLFELEKMLGWVKDGQRIHIKHGHFRFAEGKMSTRKGNVIWLEDVLEEAERRAWDLSKQDSYFEDSTRVVTGSTKFSTAAKNSNPGTAVRINNAGPIAVGALKWNDLKRNSIMDIVFDWDDILNMHGNSGPYIQYAFVRSQSVLKKAGADSTEGKVDLSVNLEAEELELLKMLLHYPEIVQLASDTFSPSLVCNYLFGLSQKFNLFYQKYKIAENPVRLQITQAVGVVLNNGLNLLGIETVNKM